MGPESLRKLLKLPLQAIEFAAFGGTNFARVELLRDENASQELFKPLSRTGEDAGSMVGYVNKIISDSPPACKELIKGNTIPLEYWPIRLSNPSTCLECTWGGFRKNLASGIFD